MDLLDRRIARRIAARLPLAPGEEVLDFDVGTNRPVGRLPPPFPPGFDEHAQVEVAATTRALYLLVRSRSYPGEVVRLEWGRLASFGPHRAEGRWRRWSLRGELRDGTPVVVCLGGRPRRSMVATLAEHVEAD